MTEKKDLNVVRIEINSGTFSIPAGDKLYEITVRQSPTIAETLDAIVVNEIEGAGSDSKTLSVETAKEDLQRVLMYKEISEDMFREIGRLARDLSISIKDLPSCYQKEVDFEKAGMDLESAKDMLADVVQMTETATMNIMDISEDMQEQCGIIQQALEDVRGLNFVGSALDDTEGDAKRDPLALMHTMLLRMRELRNSLAKQFSGLLDGSSKKAVSLLDVETIKSAIMDINTQVDVLEQAYNHHVQSSDKYMIVNDNYSMVKKEDHDRLIAALESSDHVIQCIISNIGRILESLSFQDLSGQRIIKIVDLLSNVQIQLLSILVSSGVKLKYLREGRSIKKGDTEKEFDQLMSRFETEKGADGKSKQILNQEAIDSLLEDLGF